MNDSSPQPWLEAARAHAMKYLVLFANNPGVEKIIREFDAQYSQIQDPVQRLHHLAELAAKEWDFRKGRERWQVTESFAMDDPHSKLGNTVHEGAREAEMASASSATLRHYSILAILGGAYRSPYNRLKYALEQDTTSDMMAFLGSEREVLPPEQAQTADYAPGAHTEFDLGVGAVTTLMGDRISGGLEYEVKSSESRVAYLHRKDGVPILLLSAPPRQGRTRANTGDTYEFLRNYHGAALDPTKNMLITTASTYRYGQYFDAVREISLKTGADIEVIGFEPGYDGIDFKPSQFLQELKSAADAAVRLLNALA